MWCLNTIQKLNAEASKLTSGESINLAFERSGIKLPNPCWGSESKSNRDTPLHESACESLRSDIKLINAALGV